MKNVWVWVSVRKGVGVERNRKTSDELLLMFCKCFHALNISDVGIFSFAI